MPLEKMMYSQHQKIVKEYSNTDHKKFMTVVEATALSQELAQQVQRDGKVFDGIIGIANGAIMPATIIAEDLGLPLEIVRIRRKGSAIKRKLARFTWLRGTITFAYKLPLVDKIIRLLMNQFNQLEDIESNNNSKQTAGGNNYLIVDDAIETGQTIVRLKEMHNDLGLNQYLLAVISWSNIYDSKRDKGIVPDYFINRKIQHYPWSQNSHHFSEYESWLAHRGLKEWD